MRAAADGRVVSVGHVPDGAMVVLIAHAAPARVALGHLDDGLRLPTVKAGDPVRAGDVIGAIGMDPSHDRAAPALQRAARHDAARSAAFPARALIR